MVGRRTGLSQSQGIEVYCPDNGIGLTRFTFTAADGTEYEFRDVQSDGATMDNVYQLDPNNEFICNLVLTHPRGRVFVTSDGSAATFISDVEINDHSDSTDPYSSPPGELAYPTGYLFMRDGTCYRIGDGGVVWMRDRNGNRITFQYEFINPNWRTTITDSLNRVVTIDKRLHDPVSGREYDLIAYKGFGGASRTIKLWYTELGLTLRPDFGTEAKTYEFLFPTLSGSDQTPFNPTVVAEIELPDGRKYFLKYNYYGELARVDLPTGGRFEYDYAAGVTGGDPAGVVTTLSGRKNIYRRVTERRVYKDGGTTLELKETYSRPENNSGGNQGYVEVQHLAGDAVTILARERHFYFGSPKNSFEKEPYHYANWKDGKESQTRFFDKGANGALLRTVDNTWQQPTAGNTWPLTGQGETSDSAKPNQPQITAVTTTLEDTGQVSKQTFTYDQFTNKTEVKEYDFGAGSPPASPVRRTTTSYLTSNLTVNYTTVNPNTTTPDPNATVHIRSLPVQQSVYDGAGTEKARSTYEYDNYTGSLWDRSDITGHARMLGAQATHTVSYLTRGNATLTTQVVLGSPDLPLSTRMEYDIAGNVRSVIDPKTNTTTFEFNDRFGTPDDEAQGNTPPAGLGSLHTYAFATKVTNALSHSEYTQFDYYLGRPVNGEDANGAVARGEYDDDLDRATELEVGIFTGSQLRRLTKFTYDDTARTITTQSDQTTYNDQAFKTVSLYDGLGRTFETRSYETASAYITSKQEFDELGRVKRSYNPFRTTSDETYGYADTTYDGLGRVTKVETFNASAASTGAVTTAYSGNATTVTDQASKVRRSIVDGLGRLTRVDEPDVNGSLGTVAAPTQPTSYVYDVLDNLAKVSQGGQSRFFMYDSLKRLIRARNPEQDINPNISPALTDPLTGNSQWCFKYVYDENSNLITRTDARNITTTYGYDALNRVTTRTYTNDPQSTPAVSYKYDGEQLPDGFPAAFNRGFSTGRLVAVTYGGTSAGNYTGYDKLGRVTSSYQQTDSQNYGFVYSYDLAGEMLTESYPGGRVITNAYDMAGRLISVNGQKTGEQPKTYASQFSYAAHRAVGAMQLGNSKWEHTSFNNRLQPTLIGLGTSSTDSSILRLDYGYGTTNNNGNVLTQKITAPGLTLNQCYGYDSLNRVLTAEERSGGTNCAGTQQWKQAFSYDRYGNRNFDLANTTANVLGPNPAASQTTNRFTSGGYGYDGGGNLSSDPATSSNGIVYDAENKQRQYTKTGQQTNSYYYDGDGNRVKKVDSSGTTVFVYNAGGQLIAEHTSGSPSGGGTSYLTGDHLGSTRAVMKSDGSVARHDFLPFGEELQVGVGGRTAGLGYVVDNVRQKFTQKERDNESGLDYFGARYYSSSQGRFTSPDSVPGGIANPQSLNLYTYVLNNPLKFIDPTGHLPILSGLAFPTAENWQRYQGDESLTFADIGLAPLFREQVNILPEFDQIVAQPADSSLLGSLNRSISSSFGVGISDAINADHTPTGPNALIWQGMQVYGAVGGLLVGSTAGSVLELGAEVAGQEVAGELIEGLFSIWDWSGYPEGGPKPEGPVRLLDGSSEEYKAADKASGAARKAAHAADSALDGLDLHHVHPIQFGGNPAGPMIPLTRAEHAPYNTWWRELAKAVRRR